MGLDVYLCKGNPKEWEGSWDYDALKGRDVELPSTKYPKHYFKIGYFRSSYNSSGINSVLENLGIPTLYNIFQRTGDDYVFCPNWEVSLVKAGEVLALLRKKEKEGAFNASHVSSLEAVKSEKEAVEIFMREKKSHKNTDYTDYQSREGAFHMKGTKIFAIIPGQNTVGTPGAFIVYKQDLKFYTQALEIIIETIEWVLSQDKPMNYCLRWSS